MRAKRSVCRETSQSIRRCDDLHVSSSMAKEVLFQPLAAVRKAETFSSKGIVAQCRAFPESSCCRAAPTKSGSTSWSSYEHRSVVNGQGRGRLVFHRSRTSTSKLANHLHPPIGSNLQSGCLRHQNRDVTNDRSTMPVATPQPGGSPPPLGRLIPPGHGSHGEILSPSKQTSAAAKATPFAHRSGASAAASSRAETVHTSHATAASSASGSTHRFRSGRASGTPSAAANQGSCAGAQGSNTSSTNQKERKLDQESITTYRFERDGLPSDIEQDGQYEFADVLGTGAFAVVIRLRRRPQLNDGVDSDSTLACKVLEHGAYAERGIDHLSGRTCAPPLAGNLGKCAELVCYLREAIAGRPGQRAYAWRTVTARSEQERNAA